MSLFNRSRPGSRLLMLVTDRRQCGDRPLAEVVAEAVAGGVNAVQLREKDLAPAELFDLARRLRGVCGPDALLLVNDRVDIALMVGADGVHLGESSVPVAAARKLLPPSMLVGRSVHSVNAAREAEQDGADYVLVGTLFASPSHPEVAPAGVELLRNVKSRVSLSVLGIGGIRVENADACWQAGADGIAVQSAILQAGDPRAAAARLAPVPEEP